MGSFGIQLKQVLRRLARAPMFTAITLFTLVAAVGANSVVFSVLNGVLLKPLPYPHPEELVGVWLTAPGVNIKELVLSPSTYFVVRDQGRTFQDIGLFSTDSDSVTGVGQPEQVRTLDVTDGTLPILGIAPALGRSISRDDDVPSSPETVMLSFGYWQSKFGGVNSVLGKTINVDGRPRIIIGVLPRDFHFLDQTDPALILPLRFDRSKLFLGNFSFQAIARLRPGVTIAQASSDVARLLPIVNRSFPAPEGFSIKLFEQAHIAPNLRPLKQDVVGDIGSVLWVLMGSIGVVLLIACANVANLILVRVEGRRQELAVRSALGAGRGRIAFELLFESVILGLLGCVLGLAVAWGTLRVLVALAPAGLPRIHEIGIDGRVVLFTFLLAVLASLLFGSIPIFKYAGVRLNAGLREGARGLSQSRDQHRARSVLVVVQVGLAVVLLICSGLMIRTFRELMHVDPGFGGPGQVQTFRIYIPEAEVKDPVKVARMSEEILRRLAAISGVSSVGISTKIPMDMNGSFDPVFAEDHDYKEGELPPVRRFKFTSPGFLQTLGTPLIAGRDLTWQDIYQTLPVALVSENFAREYWHDPANALGKRIRVSSTDDWRQVVGVVGNVYDDGVSTEPPSSVYWPLVTSHFESDALHAQRDLGYAIRSPRAGTESFLQEVRQAVWSLDPNLPLADVHPLDYFYNRSMARTSFTLIMLGVAGGMALLLGVVGIYGVIAYSVSQRTREIGIRMALGAQPQSVTRMFVRHGVLLAGVGVVFGLGAAFATMRLMSSLLFRVSPTDPITYVAVSLGLIATAMLACYLPSRRAAAVDPVEALRAE
ncbi:MAG TPA: ABC transporter permease [Candidatus Limnocylindrales bacterium]|nr:ABC transporter permease [Candidatus Limnocylindrales bacterium]